MKLTAEQDAIKDRKRVVYSPRVWTDLHRRKTLDSHALTYAESYDSAWWKLDNELFETRGYTLVS
jgi:hypothetical protein